MLISQEATKLFLSLYAVINEVKSYSSGMDYKCTLHMIIQVHSHSRYCIMLVFIAHPFGQLVYALVRLV